MRDLGGGFLEGVGFQGLGFRVVWLLGLRRYGLGLRQFWMIWIPVETLCPCIDLHQTHQTGPIKLVQSLGLFLTVTSLCYSRVLEQQ